MSLQQQNDQPRHRLSSLARLSTWVVTFACFYLVYTRTQAAAAVDGMTVLGYLRFFFESASWSRWLLLMIPYSLFFFLVDSHATWRVIRWFNSSAVRFRDILPIRASAYILSLLNEQVGKGAMSLYLLRRHQIPGWQAVSSMILLAVVEVYQLLLFSALGVFLYFDLVVSASSILPLATILLWVYGIALVYLPLHLLYFSGRLFKQSGFRDKPIFHALRQARWLDYVLILLCKAPNLLMAIVVYTLALQLFSVDVRFEQMLAFLPVIFIAAALPLPFHAGALLLWTVLFPEYPEVGVFSLVMHTFFVTFNACIGLVFLPVANRELFLDGLSSTEPK